MGLRCLLGHDFGEPETERERTEEGNEVVVTVREVKTCNRCGEKQVVSENKEIKSIDQLREAGGMESSEETGGAEFDGEPTAEVEPKVEPETGAVGGPEAEAETDAKEPSVGEIIEDAEAGEPIAETSPGAEAGTEETVSGAGDETPVHPAQRGEGEDAGEGAETDADDAVILDENAPDDERGQWNEEAEPDEVAAAGPDAEEPVTAGGDAGDEDAVIMGGEESGETGTGAGAEPGTETAAEPVDEELSEPTTPDEESEGGIIMGDEEPEEPASEPASEHAPWPDQRGDDEGHSAESPDGQPAGVDFGGGLAPDSDEVASNGAQTEESSAQATARGEPRDGARSSTEAEADADGGEAQTESSAQSGGRSGGRSRPASTLDLEESEREANLEYYCPECGLTRSVGNSSMRAGDICPECRRGYIEERERTSAN